MNLSLLNSQRFNPEILYVYHSFNENYTGNNHHHDFLEMSIILSGSVLYNVEGNSFQVKKGDVLVFNPGVSHFESGIENKKNRQLHIGFRNFLMEGLPRNTFPITDLPVHLYKYQDECLSICQNIIDEKEQRLPGYEIVLKALFMKLMTLIFRELTTDIPENTWDGLSFESNEKQQIVSTIIAYMEDNYMHDISLTKISENIYLSPVYISKIFKEETGDSPINYLIQIRLSQAKKLLETGQMSVKSAAKAVGYIDAYYFSKLFKKHYGYPPSQAMKKN